jgi:signal peptidase I
MLPTLLVGDFILVNKFTYGIRLPIVNLKLVDMKDPQRGEVMVFALEMKQGWFEFNGVKPGAQLDLKALAEALRLRGFSPAEYGLK